MSYSLEPFMPDLYAHNKDATAYPFSRATGFSPINVFFGWRETAHDEAFLTALRQSVLQLERAAIADGDRNVAKTPVYPNGALYDTSLEKLYGTRLPALRNLKRRVDPANVMGLAGGFKIKA